jgi:hypothetical protein
MKPQKPETLKACVRWRKRTPKLETHYTISCTALVVVPESEMCKIQEECLVRRNRSQVEALAS